ncbi:hypothetical protein, partial [Candidatus Ichthyocystis sparus]|uniref:hypothetical protein n=1 Tax=Candidatus Ichthyocystis sparus TaxID=1561004 RepID=UPI000A5EDF66
MYPISVTSAAAFSDAAEGGGDGDSREGAAVQASISGDDVQKSEGHFAIASSDVTSNIAVAVDEGVSTNGRGGSSFQRRCTTEAGVSSSDFTADGGVFDLLGIMAPLEGAQIIDSLFLKVDVFARRIYEDTVANQLPPDISGKLTATGRAIWHGTYRVMCEASFVSMCLREYHSKHRPGFIRAIPRIRLLSSSSGSDAVSLAGDGLLNFLSRLDCAVRTKVESIFNYAWSQVVDSTLSALEGGSLNSVVCKDFADVLDIAGVPAAALSAAHSAMYTISKGTG